MKKVLFLMGALPIFFASCNNEVETVMTEQGDLNQEVVGAKLVGTDFVLKASRYGQPSSRLDYSTGVFSEPDLLGLGWYDLRSNITADQLSGFTWTKANTVTDYKLYGNHKFECVADNEFETHANVYEGAHFAYYPYVYMPKIDKMTIVANDEDNPQTEDFKTTAMNKSFWISAQDTIKAGAFVDGVLNKEFSLNRMMNFMKITTVPDATFTGDVTTDGILKNMPIVGVTISTGTYAPFHNQVTIQPSKLPNAIYDTETGEFDREATNANMTVSKLFGNALALKKSTAVSSITAYVDNDEINLSKNQEICLFLFPTTAKNVNRGDIEITVEAPAGYFTINYVEERGEDDVNNKAIDHLIAYLSEEGRDGYSLTDLHNFDIPLKLELNVEDFVADYTDIDDIDTWNYAVRQATALGQEDPVFTITGDIEFSDKIELPVDCGTLTVLEGYDEEGNAGELSILGNVTMPSAEDLDITAVNLTIEEDATLTVEELLDAKLIDNNGIIYAGELSSISTKTKKDLDNTDGRVEIEYGAYVYPATGKSGIIAYNVKTGDSVKKISTLIATDNPDGNAQVNTLIVSDNTEWNLLMTDDTDADDDRYNSTDGSSTGFDDKLKNINIEMNGGKIYAALDEVVTVKSLTVFGGDNTIVDVDIDKDIDVLAGSLTVDATEYEVDDNVVKTPVHVGGNINNAAEFTANVDMFAKNIVLVPSADTRVEDGYVVWYASNYTQKGQTYGEIKKGKVTEALMYAIENNDEVVLTENITITKPMTVEAGEVTLHLNGKTISCSTPYDKAQDMVAAILVEGGELTIKGEGEVNGGTGNQYNIAVRANAGVVNIEGGTFKVGKDKVSSTDQQVVYATGTAIINISGGEFKIDEATSTVKYLLNVKDPDYVKYAGSASGTRAADIIVTGGKFHYFNPLNNTAEGTGTKFGNTSLYKVSIKSGVYTVVEK